MTIEYTIQGYWHCSTIYKGHLVSQTYIYHTKREAIAKFKQYLKTL